MTERERARIRKRQRLLRQRRVKRIKRGMQVGATAALAAVALILIIKGMAVGRVSAEPVEDQIVVQTEDAEVQTETPEPKPIKSRDWDYEEGYMLAKIAMAEAECEDVEGKALVMLTVLNRVWSKQFPDSIYGVITQPRAFTAYSNGRYDRLEPDDDCWEALHLVQYEGWDESHGALYFEHTPDPGVSTWHNQNLEMLFTHGNHTFYKEKTEE